MAFDRVPLTGVGARGARRARQLEKTMEYPLRHLSIRVPWHDSGWVGTVCRAPRLNGACARLSRIAENRRDAAELPVAGRPLDELPVEQWPCCTEERATFMAPFELTHVRHHGLAARNTRVYGHFRPTRQRYPAYSAGIVPFLWLMRPNLARYRDLYELDLDETREPELGYETNWIHEVQNQRTLLEAFAAHLREEGSLCLFYAKHVPFLEGTTRILVGAGRIKKMGGLIEYERDGDGMRGMVWERPVQHSIRPNGKDGFLLPYLDVLKRIDCDASLDVTRYSATVPRELWNEFSFGSELVSHDGAIAALLSIDGALGRSQAELGVATGWQRQWIQDELIRLWKVRGPFPGLGAVLASFGLSRGLFVAHAIQEAAGENADPWPLVGRAFDDPASVLPSELRRDLKELAPTWKGLPAERRALLRLLSRFDLSADQAREFYDHGRRAKHGWGDTDRAILENPYRLYELSRHDTESLQLLTVDRGIFPDDAVRLRHPLEPPSALDSAVDLRRVRAFAVSSLENAAAIGHTLLPVDQVVDAVRGYPVRPECPVTSDTLVAQGERMAPEVAPVVMEAFAGLQLQRYVDIAELVRAQVLRRIGGRRHAVPRDWNTLLEARFGPSGDSDEVRARQEKAAALKELAEARCSVLAGPAGTGKTTVLGILCAQPEIATDGVLMLAPTGKARVRMQELAGGAGIRALTIAQFLNQHGRYEGRAGRYHLSEAPKATGFGTVLIDEASMLTEDMLGALLDALQGVKRFIFVGDPAQLPPIGAGRPFVDIIARLRPAGHESLFPRIAPGYAELTIERRQIGAARQDLSLARWFGGTTPSTSEDEVFLAGSDDHPHLRFVAWDKPEDFQRRLLDILVEELKLAGPDDFRGFNQRLGAAVSGDYDYFNSTRSGVKGAVQAVEAWQILSPIRGSAVGVNDVNRQIHERFRAAFLDLASRRLRSIPKPFGAERIVYGDKVINLSNHRRDGRRVYPQEGALGYLANGEIGITVGQWKTRGNPKILKVEFSSQSGYTYDFYGSDFREEGDTALELAYALTVHKAQGSQFGLVILVLPEGHPILSRELVYTALTRHQHRVVIMHQGPKNLLKDLASPHRSETARRMTNLLQSCRMQEFPQDKGTIFLQEGLVHRTSAGIAVRSKSELVIAEALRNAGIPFAYEQPLTLGGQTRYPDFTIVDDAAGRVVYWEHLGLLGREEYRRGWEKKLAWYRENGVQPEGHGGSAGVLVTTSEVAGQGLDMSEVNRIIADVLKD